MEIKVNGEARILDGATTLARLLADLGIEGKNLAIEHNGAFVEDDADWNAVAVRPGDALEIVRFVGGG
jgi:sulfur carrier protein